METSDQPGQGVRSLDQDTIKLSYHLPPERVLNSLPSHIALIDDHGWILFVNQAWCLFAEENGLGHPRFGIGLNYLQVSENATGPNSTRAGEVAAHIRRLLKQRTGQFRMVYPCHSDSEKRWFQLCGTCLEQSGRCFLTLAHQNITEVKAAQELLLQIDEQLRRHSADLEKAVHERTSEISKTLEELRILAYGLSHDLKAPLRAMAGFSGAVMADPKSHLSPVARDYLSRICHSAGKMEELVRAVLKYLRAGQLEFQLETCSLEEVISEVIRNHLEFQEPRASIQIPAPLPAIRADRLSLEQCVLNLLDNAVKFARPECKPEICITAEVKEKWCRIRFSDNGIGILPGTECRIFGLFERGHRADHYPGTGVGLAVVRRAMERMGGSASCEGTPGRGSIFILSFPHRTPVGVNVS